jgi:glycosyltransferase involved in cell wall biosynthesis
MGLVGRLKPWASRRRAQFKTLKARIFPESRSKLAVLSIMKNEALNVDEWIDHYIWQGADHLFIIDNGSRDDTVARVEASVHRSKITLLLRPEAHRQGYHYRRVFLNERIKKRFQWLMVADADEFWFPKQSVNLPEALTGFEGIDVIYARWSQFGCSGQETHPASLRGDLLLRHKDLGPHHATKWIVRTSAIGRNSLFVHKVRGACSSRTVTDTDHFQLNHYMTQSMHFWQTVKMERGDASTPSADRVRTIEIFNEYNIKSVVEDRSLADLMPR